MGVLWAWSKVEGTVGCVGHELNRMQRVLGACRREGGSYPGALLTDIPNDVLQAFE